MILIEYVCSIVPSMGIGQDQLLHHQQSDALLLRDALNTLWKLFGIHWEKWNIYFHFQYFSSLSMQKYLFVTPWASQRFQWTLIKWIRFVKHRIRFLHIIGIFWLPFCVAKSLAELPQRLIFAFAPFCKSNRMIPVWPVNVCRKIVNYRIRNANNSWIFGLKLPSSAANINAVAPTLLVASIFAQFLMSRSTISWLPTSEKMN